MRGSAMDNSEENELQAGEDRLDPIQFEVIRNALVASTQEMATALRRSAFSTNVKTRGDFFLRVFRPPSSSRRPSIHPTGASWLSGRACFLGRCAPTAQRSSSRAICW